MKFIFPQNYSFANKLFGIIDYSTVFFFIIFGLLLYGTLYMFVQDLFFRLFLFILLFLPVLLFGIIGFNHEKITYVFYYLLRYAFFPKYYVFYKIPPSV